MVNFEAKYNKICAVEYKIVLFEQLLMSLKSSQMSNFHALFNAPCCKFPARIKRSGPFS